MRAHAATAFGFTCATVLLQAVSLVGACRGADDIVLREGLAIPPSGRGGRSPIHQDAIEAAIVAGKWSAPKPGDSDAEGSNRQWQPIQAGDDGWFRGQALGGGYVHCAVPAEKEQVMLLDAAGHGMVYVNGEPRTGDPYSNGWVRVPVQLHEGKNDLLFQVARGQLRAKLVPPRAAAQFDLADTTLPDLIVGQAVDTEAAVVVLNGSVEPLDRLAIEATLPGGDAVRTPLPDLLPLGVRKVGFRLAGRAPGSEGETNLEIKLLRRDADRHEWQTLDTATITLAAKQPTATHKRTFRSAIDGSVQYFAVVPIKGSGFGVQGSGEREQRSEVSDQKEERPALILTLHGAGVEAIGQAHAYLQKDWAHVVAPTNRRPFGFDWEDWGRLDAMEVLDLAQRQLKSGKTYLTGHSMGGHGVWQIGAHFPDRFAAIGPSAGWVSMFSYAGARRPESPTAMGELLARSASASDTLALARNYAQYGVYVLHGEKDDNVPVGQARTMKDVLEKFHTDFVYHEEPGMGHWWGKEGIPGTACVDWPPMWEFFRKHRREGKRTVREIEFVTVSPGVSAWSHWVGIEAQIRQFAPSSVRMKYDVARQRFSGTTDNVARLAIDMSHLEKGRTFEFELDGQKSPRLELEDNQSRMWMTHESGRWNFAARSPPAHKGPHRYGPFKDAFRNHVLFVYGTQGTPEENAWAFAKARFDAESFWYRGNASVDVWSDTEFEAESASGSLNPNARVPFADRNVILYGSADTNEAWDRLLKDSPVQVRRSRIEIADRLELGDDLACLFVRPRPGSDVATVGVVAGSGLAGMRLTDRLPYFSSGVGYPDCIVLDTSVLGQGPAGIHGVGFFGLDWSVPSGEFVWRE